MKWLNESVTIINTTFQFLDIYISIYIYLIIITIKIKIKQTK